MNSTIRIFTFIGFILLFVGCAKYKAQYQEKFIPQYEVDEPVYTVYLIGDAGNAPLYESTTLFDFLKQEVSKNTTETSIVWLGDNIYPVGLAPVNHQDHELGRHRLLAQASICDSFPGKVFFIPGNHDWYTYGLEGLKRQEELLESYLDGRSIHSTQNKSTYFTPDNGCPGPTVHELNNNLVLVVIDSQWYLSSRFNEERLNKECIIYDGDTYLEALDSVFTTHSSKNILLTSHHPMYTYGKHGGHYKLKYYLFPLTQTSANLPIPMPVSGTMINILRPYFSEQDVKHPLYKKYRDTLVNKAFRHKNTIIASGHEHNLQYIEKDGVPIIVSGAGSKKSAVTLGEGSKFAIGAYGYTILKYYQDRVVVQFFAIEENEIEAKEYYRSIIPIK